MKFFSWPCVALFGFPLLAGCFSAALMLAPLGLQATEAIGITAARGISGKHYDDEDLDRGAMGGCDELAQALPYVAEVRLNGDGAIDLRQWIVGKAKGGGEWIALEDKEGGGWHTEPNIGALNFTPSLQTAMAGEDAHFLISAPIEAASEAETRQQISFVAVFGPRTGTYRWKDKSYQYSLARKLPCFPVDAASKSS